MILDTRRLFLALLRALEIDTVCDIGSMNGSDALAFRRALPRARVLACEANPHNARLMQGDAQLREQAIEVLPLAVTNFDGESAFHLVKADYASVSNRRGMSSLHPRSDARLHDGTIQARTARLDTLLGIHEAQRRIALWVDVEGAACEALEGAQGLFAEIQLVHVEVETAPCIASRQRLYPELEHRLSEAGFARLATDHPPHFDQFNALFVRRDLDPVTRSRMRWHVWRLWVRRQLSYAVQRVCPGCARRILQLRHGH